MSETAEPVLQDCPNCGALIDVTDEEPFTLAHCPTCGAAMRVRRTFGNFELQEVLGAGGMGAVYRALDVNLNRACALKLLRKEYSADPEFIRQFEYEAAITASINHPNVVKVFSTGTDHGLVYIAMELVDKGSLDDLMGLQSRVPEAQVLEVGIQMAHGLNAALQRGLIHRDVKPGNILFAEAHHAKIVDFGLAVLADKAAELGGEVWGTPYYVAPEKLDKPPQEDFRSDMYSLGATLFHAVAGRPPYEAADASMVALKHLKSQAVSLQAFAPDVSSATAYVINKTLHKNPNQRYQSYEELIQNLEYARTQLLTKASQPVRPRARVVLEDSQSQKMMSMVTLGLLGAMLLGGASLWFFRDKVFQKKETVTEVGGPTTPGAASVRPKYEAAQALLVENKFVEAAEAFRQIETSNPDMRQPQHNWVTFHAGLCWMLAGKIDEARKDFDQLAKRDATGFSSDPTEQKLAAWFKKTAKLAADKPGQSPSVAADYSKRDYESLAVLVFAAENWSLGRLDEAKALYSQFAAAFPEGTYDWVEKYKPIAKSRVTQFAQYKTLHDQIKAVEGDPEGQKQALPKLRETAKQLNLSGQLADQAEAVMKGMEKSIKEYEDEMARLQLEMEAEDVKALSELRPKADLLCMQYKFPEAKALVTQLTPALDNGKRAKEALIKKIDWLIMFRALLIQDITVVGFGGALAKKNGAQIPGTVSGADDQKVIFKTAYGAVPIPWTDISADSIFAMGKAFIKPGLPPDRIADRQWCLGVYAFFNGKAKEGRELVTEGAKNKAEYKEQLPLFLEFAEAK